MKKSFFIGFPIFFLLIIVLVNGGRNPASNQEEYSSQEEYVPNELLVKFKKNTEKTKIQAGFEVYLKNGYVFVLYDWTGPNVTTYWDYDLSPGYYTYYVRAYNQDGNSTKTLYVTAKII